MRKSYIDNLRTICILLLFPFHTAMIFNNWGEVFYINGTPKYLPSLFVVIVYPWWMTLLFVIAGISSYYALKNKSGNEFINERIHKLLVPFLIGLVLVIPIQSYIADIYHNQYTGSYFKHLILFFTRFTDLTGGDGGFTPGHLWFMIYLYLISYAMLPFMSRYLKAKKKIPYEKLNIVILILLFIIVLICTPILEIGKSFGEASACFALGFFVLSNDIVQEKLQKYKWLLGGLFFILMLTRIVLWNNNLDKGLFWDIEYRLYLWNGILFFLGFGKSYLNKANRITIYFTKASFSLYYFHQSVLIVIGYIVLKYVPGTLLQFIVIMVGTFILSIGLYELFRRFKVTSYMFGIKYTTK